MLTRSRRTKNIKEAIPVFEVDLDASKNSICYTEPNEEDTEDTEPKSYYMGSNKRIVTKNLVNYHVKNKPKPQSRANNLIKMANKIYDINEDFLSIDFKLREVQRVRAFPRRNKRSISVERDSGLTAKQ
jgi:hypothetical protein